MDKWVQARKMKSYTTKYVPNDVLVDLLSRLPVKSIYRFRCVSKEWLSLISSSGPGSVKDVRRCHKQRTPFLLVGFPSGASLGLYEVEKRGTGIFDRLYGKFEPNFLSGCHRHTVTYSNGLVCFAMSYYGERVHICNPSTQETVKLHEPVYSDFDCVIGFGYISSTNTYKIVRLCPLNRETTRCEIITLRDGKNPSPWRETERLPDIYLKRPSVCLEGVIYWLICGRHEMLAFDLATEESSIIPHPKILPSANYLKRLVDLGGSLHLTHWSETEASFKIWMFKPQATSNWVPKYTILC